MTQNKFKNFVRALTLSVLAALAALLPSAARAQFGGGEGTKNNPYIISTTDHMDYLAEQVNGGNKYEGVFFRLANDLDYDGKTYHVIGRVVNGHSAERFHYPFQGIFDGNGKTIRNVTIDAGAGSWADTNNCIGLFGVIGANGIVENLTLGGASTIKARSNVGGIVGYASGEDEFSLAYITNCHVESGVTIEPSDRFNNEYIGGIVGAATLCFVSYCTNAATVIGDDEYSYEVGGVVGYFLSTSIQYCTNTGSVSGAFLVGGVAGRGDHHNSNKPSSIYDCTNTASVTGKSYVGGLVGEFNNEVLRLGNAVGGACTIGALGVEDSSQGTDTGIDVTRIYSASINKAQVDEGSIDTPPVKIIDGTNYYTEGTLVTLSGLYTFGKPAGEGMVWGYRANLGTSIESDHAPLLPQEDGTWQFTMPSGNVLINSFGARDFTHGSYLQPSSHTAFYTGEPQWPIITRVVSHGYTLTEGTDYVTDIPSEGFTSVGKHPFRIWGIGAYSGLRTDSFVIERAPLTSLTLSETSVYHDGMGHKPTLTVKAGSKTLTPGTDYQTDMPGASFTDLGNYTIKVWGIGNYTDTLSATYTIQHPWEGMGTYDEPFLIKTTDDMDRLATLVNGGKTYEGVFFRQTENLDFTGRTYTPVGNSDNKPFQGTYFGDARSMTGINVNGGYYVGVFGHIGDKGSVRQVSFTGTNSFSGSFVAGSIAGWNFGTIEWCYVQIGANVSVNSDEYGGGIAGANYGTISMCDNRANVTAKHAGGIAGHNSGTIEYATNYATVTGNSTCGGIVGENDRGTISGQHLGSVNCTNSYGHCGGIVGFNYAEGIVEYSLSNDLMTGVVSSIRKGAIAGRNGGTLRSNYYIGDCRFKGIGNDNDNNNVSTDVTTQAMRGWPISHDESIGFNQIPDASGNIIGTYYDDGTNNYYYVGAGETLRFILFGGTGYTANGTALTVAGHDDNYGEDYYELTMPAAPVHIAPVGLMLTLYDNFVNFDNEGYIAAANGQVRNVKIEGRTFYKDGEWNTICLPFAIADLTGTPLEGATVMELDTDGTNGVDNATGTLHLTFKNATGIVAGRPYIIKWDSGTDITDPVFTDVTVDASQPADIVAQSAGLQPVTFKGTYMFPWVGAYDKTQLFLTAGSQLKYATEARRLLPFRAWFTVDDGTAQSVRGFALDFGGAVVTGMGVAPMLDGSRPAVYDLHGRRVLNPQQGGVYIVNGKKVIF